MGDNDLGTFLRARREAVAPADVGLPVGSRRRTPGLRRSELATLAGVSVDYLTRLEQGRDRNPSPQVLAVLADALRMSAAQRQYVLGMIRREAGAALMCPVAGAYEATDVVRATVRALLERLEPTPAYVASRVGDLLAHTDGFARLFGPLGLLDAGVPNLVRYVFADPRARAAFPDWAAVADEQAARLRSGSCPQTEALADELRATVGAAFGERFDAVLVVPATTGVDYISHPEVGELRLAYEVLEVAGSDDQRLVTYVPADAETTAALERLDRPAVLAGG